MAITDAERSYYESVVDDPEGKSLSDLKYAYFLKALDEGAIMVSAPPAEGTFVLTAVDGEVSWVESA